MRVSERQRYDITSARVEKAKGNNADMLEQISTQKRINHLSDDPIGAGQVMRERGKLETARQFQKNIDFSRGYIERSEGALMGLTDNLMRAKELAVGQASDTYGPDSRASAAREIKEIVNQVISLGNTTYGNRYVFSGFRSQTPALSMDGQYLGDDGAVYLQVDPTTFRQINLQARHLFEASHDEAAQKHINMIDTLKLLHDGLNENDKDAIAVSLDELDFQMSKVTSYQAMIGAIDNALSGSLKRLELDVELLQGDISRIEDADVYEASSDFKRTETVLQSTLMASNKLLQPSLLNFMQ